MKLAAFVLSSIAGSIQYYAAKYKQEDFIKTLDDISGDFGLPRIKAFDYIVVGAGTGGSVIAGRLSESFNVLLLEAGGPPTPMSDVPFLTNEVGEDPETNYFFHSIPQTNASLKNDGVFVVTTGKMLGGSGSHNDMVYNRGSPHDYDNFARILQDDSWTYANVLNYFKKAENYTGVLFNEGEEDYYGTEGPLIVDTDTPLILEKWFQAGRELGYFVGDANGYQKEGFSPVGKLIYQGRRLSTYQRYIKPFQNTRDNLTVIPYAQVSKILLDDKNRAYGVAYSRHGIPQIAHASKEVIISTGTFVTPILLMQSGIGPKEVLNEAEIPVKVDSPRVGHNLRDHVFVLLSQFKFNESGTPLFPRVQEAEFEQKVQDYLATGKGVFGDLQEGPQALIVSSRASGNGEEEWPDSRITFKSGCPTAFEDEETPSACIFVTVDRMKSNGLVTLNTTAYKNGETDVTKLAVIDPKTFGESSDLEVLLEHIKFALKIMENTTAFRGIGARYEATADPSCSQFQFRTDDYWRCYIEQNSYSAIHMVGTCSMGVEANTVTDSKGKVKGTSALRIVDASILPLTPNANLNMAVVMLAEKAAHEILSNGRLGKNPIS